MNDLTAPSFLLSDQSSQCVEFKIKSTASLRWFKKNCENFLYIKSNFAEYEF